MAYTVETLIDHFRSQMDDTVEPYYFSDEDILGYMDGAQKAFARVTKLFIDEVPFTVTAANKYIDIPENIVELRKAYLTSNGAELTIGNLSKVNELTAGSDDYGRPITSNAWMTKTGTPSFIINDVVKDKGRLVPIPVANDTITGFVARLPATDITSLNSRLEVTDSEHQRIMVLEMMSLAYSKHDSDVQNEKASTDYHGQFMTRAEAVAHALDRKRTVPRTVKYRDL